jgi:hypothetical protein
MVDRDVSSVLTVDGDVADGDGVDHPGRGHDCMAAKVSAAAPPFVGRRSDCRPNMQKADQRDRPFQLLAESLGRLKVSAAIAWNITVVRRQVPRVLARNNTVVRRQVPWVLARNNTVVRRQRRTGQRGARHPQADSCNRRYNKLSHDILLTEAERSVAPSADQWQKPSSIRGIASAAAQHNASTSYLIHAMAAYMSGRYGFIQSTSMNCDLRGAGVSSAG